MSAVARGRKTVGVVVSKGRSKKWTDRKIEMEREKPNLKKQKQRWKETENRNASHSMAILLLLFFCNNDCLLSGGGGAATGGGGGHNKYEFGIERMIGGMRFSDESVDCDSNLWRLVWVLYSYWWLGRW